MLDDLGLKASKQTKELDERAVQQVQRSRKLQDEAEDA